MSTDSKTSSVFQITGDLLLEFMKEIGKSANEISKNESAFERVQEQFSSE